MLQSQQIKELRQSGKLQEALDLALIDLEQDHDNIYAKRNISWVYYAFLKKSAENSNLDEFYNNLEKVKNLNLPESELMLFDNIAWQTGILFFHIAKNKNLTFDKIFGIVDIIKIFHFTKPSEGYSFLLKSCHKLLKQNHFPYIKYLSLIKISIFHL